MNDRRGSGEEDVALDARKRALRQQLDSRMPKTDEPRQVDTSSAKSGISQAWRLSSEFVAGVLVGTGIGWSIDYLFSTGPWGLIIFVMLGFAAAVVNVMRAAGQMAPSRLHIHPRDDDNHTQ